MPAPPRSRRRITPSPASTRRSKETNTSLRCRFVGGKGGVGKTTCAAGMAVAAALGGARTLVISTDPAPSLGDAFARRLRAVPMHIRLARGRLDAVEIDARSALDRWIHARRPALERIALRGTWLDQEDIARLLRLSLPGIDELAALFEIGRFAQSGRYDLIVVDTAPTGHTLRMLTMPQTLRAVARVFDHMQARHRVIVEALRGWWTPDAEDALIEQIDRDGRELHDLLRDPSRVQISWVTLPEPMAVEETVDAARALDREGIPFSDVIVNRLTPAREAPCAWCDRRRVLESKSVAELLKQFPRLPLRGVAARASEPKGTRALAAIGAELSRPPGLRRSSPAAPRGVWRAASPGERAAFAAAILPAHSRLVLFGGKGGVGKTTCAAAASIAIAHSSPGKRVLLLSTDPAHSLADALGVPLSDEASRIRGAPANLAAREMDAAAGFRTIRTRYAEAIDTLFDRLTRSSGGVGIDAGHDRRVMHGLIDLAPPGIDELAAVIDVTDTIESNPDQIVIMDTAPSGHALRLLEMPGLVQDWTKALMAIVLKYQPVTGIGAFGAILLKLSQGLGRLRALLADPDRASFVVVSRGASLPRVETLRLVARLAEMGIHVPAAIVNVAGRGTCKVCRVEAAVERREIAALRRRLRGRIATVVAPAELPPPQGPRRLCQWQQEWRRP